MAPAAEGVALRKGSGGKGGDESRSVERRRKRRKGKGQRGIRCCADALGVLASVILIMSSPVSIPVRQ